MSGKVIIKGIGNGLEAEVVNGEGPNALVVATRELKTYENSINFFSNPSYGADMNINATFTGTPIKIHNGIDDVLWTASTIQGIWDFNSSAQANNGSYSIDATATVNADVAQFATTSFSLSGYSAITGSIYINDWNTRGIKNIQIYGYNTVTGVIVGNILNINDYIDINTLGSWQNFIIPLNSFGLLQSTINAIRIRTIDIGPGAPPGYYLDDLQIEQTGSPVEFSVRPELGTWLHVKEIRISFVDDYSSILTVAGATENSTMPNIPYNSFLGVSKLSNPILYQRYNNGIVKETLTFSQVLDFLQIPNTSINNYGSDGTNTWFTMIVTPTEPLVLKAEDSDHLSVIINDDLTGLLFLRMSCGCKVEDRS